MTNPITIRFSNQAHFSLIVDNGLNIVGDHPAYAGMSLPEFISGEVEAIAAPAELLSELEEMFPQLSIELI